MSLLPYSLAFAPRRVTSLPVQHLLLPIKFSVVCKSDDPSISLLAASSDGNNQGDGGEPSTDANTNPARKKISVARAGGRKRKGGRKQKPKSVTKDAEDSGGIFSTIQQLLLPLFLVSLILKLLFGFLFGGNSNPNVVYYSSSVYQSTTYTRDGNVETTRKESFNSNIPGFVENARESSQRGFRDSDSDNYYLDSIEDDLADLEDEIDSSLFGKW